MLTNVCSIEIKSPFFSTPKKLNLLPVSNNNKNKKKIIRASIIFGRNGSGKSTIAKAFRSIKGEETSINSVKIYDEEDKEQVLSDKDKNQLCVFDEDFILKNIKLKDNGLDTIVMLGKSVELSNKIDEAISKKEELQNKYDVAKKTYEEQYIDLKSINSPKYYLKKMKSALQGDGNWADRDKKIKNTKINSQVTETTYKQFEGLKPQKNKNTLLNEFNNLFKQLELSRKNQITRITSSIPKIEKTYTQYNDKKLSEILRIQIENPVLSDREKFLISLIKKGEMAFVNKIYETFNNDNTEKCPFCYQPIGRKYKNDLVKSIEIILNDKVKAHKNELSKYVLDKLDFNLNDFEKLNNCKKCICLVSEINSKIDYLNNIIKEKSDNPYTPISKEIYSVSTLANQLEQELQILDNEKNIYNAAISDQKSLIEKLININNEIAYFDIKDLLKSYKQQESLEKISNANLQKLDKDCQVITKELSELQSSLNNIKIAVDEINEGLRYIFYSEDRLKINYEQNSYKLLSRGEPVHPKDISVGERNIIALCYFFSKVIQAKDKDHVYKKNEYLLIIDDPISSFDNENKIGVISYLKYKLKQFLENKNSRAILLTHDLTYLYDLQKTFTTIFSDLNEKGCYALFELKDKTITDIGKTISDFSEYTYLINTIFSFANENNKEHIVLIGNIMRQVLEAFATFQCKQGIDGIVSNKELEIIMSSNPEYIPYFNNLMNRLVLNGGSHRKEQVLSMRDYNFSELISPSEKIRTAKDVLCFIYLINSQHLIHHISIEEAQEKLEKWCCDIKMRIERKNA